MVAIEDPAGPSGTDDDLQLLVVSQETIKGGPYVNKVREGNNLSALDVFVIDMLNSDCTDIAEALNQETKLSSSSQRIRELGLIRKEPRVLARRKPYLIGMTGGIATGKSAVTRRLQKLGASAINCDKLGHQAYLPGTLAYQQLIKEFGESILNQDSTINRRALGTIVFSDKNKLTLLNQIVWPEIARMVEDKIAKMNQDDVRICVIEAAVLFEAGWDMVVNEVWVTTVPENEAIKRIVERDGYNEMQARIRIEAQISSKERVGKSHVVISTLWEPEFTQKIVEKAWKGIIERADNAKRHASFL